MGTKRTLALLSCFMLLFICVATLGGKAVLAADNQTQGSSGSSSSSGQPTPTPTASGLEVASYTTHVAGTTVTQITPGMAFSLKVRLFDTRFGSHTPADVSGILPRAKANSASFVPVDQNAVTVGTDVVSTLGGIEYNLEFVLTYTGTGNSFQADVYYEGGYGDIAPMTSISLNLNNCVPKPDSSSGSESSSQTVRGTGFALKESSYGEGNILAGQEFQLTVTMLATNGADKIENVSATLVPDKEFTLASGASTVYFGTASPNQSIPLNFNLKAAADAKDGSYKVTLNVQGVSSRTGEDVKTTVDLSIPIIQPDRLVINNFTPPDYITAGMNDGTGYTSVNIVNMGKSDISNVTVEITGEGITTEEGSTYLGTFTPGTQNSADFTVMSDTPGQYEAELVVSYENARGETGELREKFSIQVADAPIIGPDDGMPIEPPVENTGMPVWGWLLIGLGVVAAGVTAVVVVSKKRKKARDAALEDDEDAGI